MTAHDDASLGHYRLVRLLGRGGMGEVYEAVDTVKDRTVALKLLTAQLADDATYRARFLRESQIVARLNDPHVIPIHDFGEIDGRLYLDMRIVHGRDLRAIIDDGPLSHNRAVGIVSQIAGALDAAHASGLLHRDVKPENILVDENDFAYLVDFGVAQAADSTRLTQTGAAIGSFAYMAAERFGDAVRLTPAADVYSLACVLYEALTGTPPHVATSIEQMIAGHLTRPVPLTHTALDPVSAAGTAKDPAQRVQTCGAFATAAREALSRHHAPTLVAPCHPAALVRRSASRAVRQRPHGAGGRSRRGHGGGRRGRRLAWLARRHRRCADARSRHVDRDARRRRGIRRDDDSHRDR